MKFRLDQAQEILRLDASETLNLRRALEHVRSKTYDVRFPEYKGRKFVPVDNSIPNGAETVTFDTYEEVGEAAITSDYGDDAPSADVKADDDSLRIYGMQTKYSYSMQELRAAAMSGSRLSQRKANAARRAIEQKHDDILLLGNSRWGLKGLFTLAGTTTFTPSAGVWDGAKADDDILADMWGMENQLVEDTNELEPPDTLIIPLSSYNYVKTKRIGGAIDNTILEYFLQKAQHIKNVETSIKLEAAPNGEWAGKRMVAYKRDMDKLAGVIPQEFEQFAPQMKGLRMTTYCHSRAGGVQLFYPKSVCYAEGI